MNNIASLLKIKIDLNNKNEKPSIICKGNIYKLYKRRRKEEDKSVFHAALDFLMSLVFIKYYVYVAD